ncbi:MAG: nitrate- and nitrite sensing domain-containing protein, partial [Gammaproteobacteria bacterium]|nr:nitrate- and nitrite sensing domain-containing protein [Gammaproteobacteria bacterium]
MKDYLICISDLIHSLQGERGFSTLFIREKDNGDITKLKNYFQNTNNSVKEVKEIFNQLKKQGELDTEQLELIANISLHLSKLTIKREATTTEQISTAEIFDFYTFGLITPLIQLISSFSLKIKNIHPNAVSAFVFFIQWKEKVGLERLILLRGFIKHDFDNNEYQERIEFLFNEQNYYKKSFISLATIEQQEIVESIYDVPDFEILNKIRAQLSQKNVSDIISKIQVSDWFELISKKL